MLIASPVDRSEEVRALADAGADELYAGCVPPFWAEAFGPVVSSNRRSYEDASLSDQDALEAVSRAAALCDVPVFLALNAAPVPDGMIPPMVEFAADAARRGVRAVIVSDLAFLVALRDAGLRRLALHASTLFSAFNGAAVAFFRRAGAARVILPRELAVGEISQLVREAGKTTLEVIGMRGRCQNIEGFCTHLHDDPGRRWPCELAYEKVWRGAGPGVPFQVRSALEEEEGRDRYYSCGLCAVPLLERAGVCSFKIVGRGAETARKVEAVRAVCWMREFGRRQAPRPAACAREGKVIYREIFGRPCVRRDCYFPEFRPGTCGEEGGEGTPRDGR